MEGWDSFFLGQLGASAALGGLLFVAVSINLDRVLAEPDLPNRALLAIMLLLVVLLVSALMLIPHQPLALIGGEVLVLGAIVLAGGAAIEIAAASSPRVKNRKLYFINVALFAAAAAPYLIGGILLLLGDANGVYWIAVAILFSIVKAVLDAWVLLVEIQR
jgi:modulator of FtsH protease